MTTRIGNPDTLADLDVRRCLDQRPAQSFVMIAGAGSGKTTSLVKALSHLIRTRGPDLKRRGQKVACITYTVVAEQEILSDLSHSSLAHVSTIHSFLWEIVKHFPEDLREWAIERLTERIQEHQHKLSNTRTRAATKERSRAEIERLTGVIERVQGLRHFTYGAGSDLSRGVLGHDDVLRVGPTLLQRHPLLCKLVAQRFPFIFVDESQDTTAEVVAALKHVVSTTGGTCCLGFFGDPMQKIYATGIGPITAEPQWANITKPENFRCPLSVLEVINRIRAGGDGLVQTRGRVVNNGDGVSPVVGTTRLFILPADERRTERLHQVREWLAQADNDPRWLQDSSDLEVRVLVTVHRMAALRLGFDQLYSALNDRASTSIKEGFRDGTAWVTTAFLSAILPLADAAERGNEFDVITLLRQHSARLQSDSVRAQAVAAVLAELDRDVQRLLQLCADGSRVTIWEVLTHVRQSQLAKLDDRWSAYLDDPALNPESPLPPEPTDADEAELERFAVAAMLRCRVSELRGYRRYIEEESPYSTQQGIKGAEFDRVLVVIDDDEGKHPQFSYDRLLGLSEASETELRNLAEGRETVVDRTRRLFYVCCSRARQDLAIVLFSQDVERARRVIADQALLSPENIHRLVN